MTRSVEATTIEAATTELPAVLFTIGYEGRSAEGLPEVFHRAGVTCVVDVRDLPLSRKPGLSKSALSARLQSRGVSYMHEKRLGNPKPLRDWVKSGADWNEFEALFRERLRAEAGALDAVLQVLEGGDTVCLLCYEADASRCHRSLVAEALSERAAGLRVSHL